MLFDSYLSESHRLFRDTCRRFAEREIAPHAAQWEEQEAFPKQLFRAAGAAGLLGVQLPEELGGAGGDALHNLVLIEALLAGGSSGVVAGLGSLGIAAPPLLLLGSPEQQQRFLPPAARGEQVAALAITEPDAGSDVAGVRLKAVRDGERYLLSGSKVFITSGEKADWVLTLARTGEDPHGGLTFFVVERGMAGFRCARTLHKTGWRASDTAELVYDDVPVPVANRLGPEGSAFRALMHNFEGERLALAIFGHASAELALGQAMRYCTERRAFGRTLAGFQVTRHKLAQMTTRVTAAKALNYLLAQRLSQGERLPAEVAMAKNFSAQVAEEVCREAVQLLGGMGYMRETQVERLSRDVRILAIGGGTSEVMNEIICRSLPLR